MTNLTKKSFIQFIGFGVILALLSACGGGSSGSSENSSAENNTGSSNTVDETGDVCKKPVSGANWDALLTKDCPTLADYNLFASNTDVTQSPLSGGIPYDLSTQLFTDYASKYRFVFVPENTTITYTQDESFEFPVGAVLVKTFAMPEDTAFRGPSNERLIETRLLIHRANGWAALPYVWNESGTVASLAIAGKNIPMQVIHNGQSKNFTYGVPDTNKCKQCHQLKDVNTGISVFAPIGPKARHLNKDFEYNSIIENQLQHWQSAGILSGLPADINSVDKIPSYRDGDEAALASQDATQLMSLAKGYLDVNCAHCHRPEGNASNTGVHLEFWRDYENHKSNHGVCKKPIAFGGGALEYDVVPGDAINSILHARMNSDQPGDRMPEIGRGLVHEEGVRLIEAWINSLPTESCSNP